MLQISGNFRGLHGFGDAMEDAKTLQIAANRYASYVGLAPVGTDGKVGPLTLTLVRAAFKFLVSKGFVLSPATSSALTSAGALAAAATNVADTLNAEMDAIKLGGGAAPDSGGGIWQSFTNLFSGDTPSPPAAPPTPGAKPSLPATYGIAPGTTPPKSTIVGLSPKTKKYLMIGGGVLLAGTLVMLLLPKSAAKPAA